MAWFEAFATWKTCVVLEQLYQRFVRGESTDPRMGERGTPVAPLADRAAELLDRLADLSRALPHFHSIGSSRSPSQCAR